MAFFVPLTRSRSTAQSSFVSSFAFLAMTPREEEMIVFVAKREKEKYRRLTRARSKKKKTKKNRRFDSTRERSYSASLVFVARTAESLATPARDDDGFWSVKKKVQTSSKLPFRLPLSSTFLSVCLDWRDVAIVARIVVRSVPVTATRPSPICCRIFLACAEVLSLPVLSTVGFFLPSLLLPPNASVDFVRSSSFVRVVRRRLRRHLESLKVIPMMRFYSSRNLFVFPMAPCVYLNLFSASEEERTEDKEET